MKKTSMVAAAAAAAGASYGFIITLLVPSPPFGPSTLLASLPVGRRPAPDKDKRQTFKGKRLAIRALLVLG